MNKSKNRVQIPVQLLYVVLIVILMVTIISACSSQGESGSDGQSSTLPPFDGAELIFEDGKYIRDDYCARVFDYQKTTYETLTIAIENSLIGSQGSQSLAEKVIDSYIDLYNNSLVPMSQPLTVYIVSDPDIGECYSKDELVFAAPDDFYAKSYIEDLLGSGTGINEYWVKVGLTSLALGDEVDNEVLKTWYQNTDDLDMAGLFIARFNIDWATQEEVQIALMSAASLVQYAIEVEGIQPDLSVEQVNNDMRTRWLESLGVNRTVTYPYDGRFVGFTYSKSDYCSLIVQADTMRFCLNKLPDQEYFDEISEVEFLIDNAYYGRKALVEYLVSEAPSVNQQMNPNEMIIIEAMEDPSLGSRGDNIVYINSSGDYGYILFRIVYTFDWNHILTHDLLWSALGFKEYLGKLLLMYQQTAKSCVFEDLSGLLLDADAGFPPGTSYCYGLYSEQFEVAKEWYLSQGGQMENENSVDPRFYTDAVAFATMYQNAAGGPLGTPIGVKYESSISRFNMGAQKGLELSHTQAASFVAWLCDTYSIDRVLDVYVNGAEDGLLDGKTYDELKSEWHADLLSKGEGIDIPGAP